MPLKITIFYNQFQRGWTETWYSADSAPPSTLPPAHYAALQASMQIRAAGTTAFAIRYTVEGSAASGISIPLGDTFVTPQWNSVGTGAPDVVSTTAVYRLQGAPGQRKRMFLRGLPDPETQRRSTTGTDIISASLNGFVQAYFVAAKDAGWLIRQAQSPKNSAVVMQGVFGLTPNTDNPNWTNVEVADTASWVTTPPGSARFIGIPRDDLPGFPANATVQRILIGPPPGLVIAYRLRQGARYVPANMRVTKTLYNYVTWTNPGFFERYSEHKTGRPFGSLRGRSRSLVRAL